MAEATTNGKSRGDKSITAVFHVETGRDWTTPEESWREDSVLKVMYPLITCLRLFGQYFTRVARVGDESTTEELRRPVRSCRGWNFARVHATVVLVVMWLNAFRYFAVFDGNEQLGLALFMKLGLIPSAVQIVALQMTYYVASHTGSLDRVLRRMILFTEDPSPTYSRRVKVVTALCLFMLAWNTVHYAYQVIANGRLNDVNLLFVNKTSSEINFAVVAALVVILQLQVIGTWLFPQAMNYMVMRFLYDQFDRLNEEFSKCIGDRGEFSGNFQQFRRRHQLISRSVHEADRFLMISNVASVCCPVASIIIVLYSAIFYRHETVAFDAESAILYMAWLGVSVFGLSLAAGQAIILNDRASTSCLLSIISVSVSMYFRRICRGGLKLLRVCPTIFFSSPQSPLSTHCHLH